MISSKPTTPTPEQSPDQTHTPPPYQLTLESPSERLASLLEVAKEHGRDVGELQSRVLAVHTYLATTPLEEREAPTAQLLFDDAHASFQQVMLARQFGIAEEEWATFKEFEAGIKTAFAQQPEKPKAPESEDEEHSIATKVGGTMAMGVGMVVVAPVAITLGAAGVAVNEAGMIMSGIGGALVNMYKQGMKTSGKMGAKASKYAKSKPPKSKEKRSKKAKAKDTIDGIARPEQPGYSVRVGGL